MQLLTEICNIKLLTYTSTQFKIHQSNGKKMTIDILTCDWGTRETQEKNAYIQIKNTLSSR